MSAPAARDNWHARDAILGELNHIRSVLAMRALNHRCTDIVAGNAGAGISHADVKRHGLPDGGTR